MKSLCWQPHHEDKSVRTGMHHDYFIPSNAELFNKRNLN